MQLLFRRYGSLTNFNRVIASYKEIGERTSIRPGTVRNVIERFHAMGNRYGVRPHDKRPRMIPRHAEEWLCHWNTLFNMRYLPMRERARKCKERFGLARCTGGAVMHCYKSNGVSYKKPGKVNRLSEERELRLMQERIAFARKLQRLIDRGADVCYLDETTFNIWDAPKRTWMQKACSMVVPINRQKLHNITLYGAIG